MSIENWLTKIGVESISSVGLNGWYRTNIIQAMYITSMFISQNHLQVMKSKPTMI